jgi:class 3 adenylate cyclase
MIASSGVPSISDLSKMAASNDRPDGCARALGIYLVRRRHELLAPVHTITELTGLLAAEQKIRDCPRAASDLQTIASTAERMAELIGAKLGAGRVEEEAAASALNHDLRSLLTIILGYSDELRRVAPRHALEEFVAEFREIQSLARRALALVDSTVTQLRRSGDSSPIDDLQRYLERVADPNECGDEALEAATERGLILVAEDQEAIRKLLCEQLRAQGHDVVPARDGVEALSLLRERCFDLLLTDLEMPGMNGLQVLDQLKCDPRLASIPAIVISGHGELEGIAQSIKRGAEDYLPKPFNRVILKARVDACLEKKRLRDRNEHQRRRYDELLHAILPAPVVSELVQTNSVKPRRLDGIAVLFGDIVGFTPFCDQYQDQPEVVVQHLRQMFERWEALAAELGVNKIKSIGDAFMAAAGLFEAGEDPVVSCVRLGLRMIRFAQGLRDEDRRPLGFNLRVGVHVGPVISGVLGHRQSLYDIWGDTVNIAARLESHGRPGCVNLSLAAWARVAGLVSGEDRGYCLFKGKTRPTDIVYLNPQTISGLE